MTPIKYIGKRDSYTDGLYGTRITWNRGDTKDVPDDIAAKMLKHPDQYVSGKAKDSAPTVIATPPVKDTEDELQSARDMIANMEKDSLVEFAMTNYRQHIDKRKSTENLRIEVTTLVDQYGIR
jgi:hypothetical protein